MRPQIVRFISTSVLGVFTSTIMLAQQLGSDTGPPPPDQGGQTLGPEWPIDSNIVLLIVAGVIYGVYTVWVRNKTTNE